MSVIPKPKPGHHRALHCELEPRRKASWEQPFAKDQTADGRFRVAPGSEVTVPMMNDTRAAGYVAGSNFQAVALPYVGGDLKMLIVVPQEGQLPTVRSGFDEAWITRVLGSLTDTPINLSLPKFRVTWGPEDFKARLSDMGMPLAFDEARADFSNITTDEKLYITHVLQKAFVGIDEFGTEAAAASAVTIGTKSMPAETLTVDHPFLFAIVDKTGAVLFAGQVMDPR